MRRGFSDILRSKPVQTIFAFAVFSAAGAYLESPWWEGSLLAIHPELPEPSGAVVRAPEENETVKQSVARVDLDVTSRDSEPQQTVVATAQSVHRTPASGSSGSPRRRRVPQCRKWNEPAETTAGFPSLADLRLQKKITELDKKLDEPPTDLRRPCLEWYPTGMLRGFRPLCKRRAMDPFFEQLRDVAVGEASRPVRLTQLGDSLVAGDAFTGELRRLLQDQFGSGGYGWIHPGEASPHVGTRHLTVDTSSAWKTEDVIWQPHSDFKMGLAGVAFSPRGNPSIGIYPHDEGKGRIYDRIGLLYYRKGRSSQIHLKYRGEQSTVDLSGQPNRNDLHWISVEKGAHDVRLAGFDPTTYVYGILLEQSGPGVVVDNLGLSSARAPRLRFIDPSQWQKQIRLRNSDLVSFAYGVNSAGKRRAAEHWLEEYRRDYASSLETARNASDEVGCLVVSLLTRGTIDDGEIEIYDSVRPLVRYQSRAADGAHCGFWNAFEAMGGEAGARRWYENRPQLLGSDLAHPTGAGYKKLANLFYASLIEEFRRYIDERVRRTTIPDLREDDGSRPSDDAPKTAFLAD